MAWRGAGGEFYYHLTGSPYRALEELSLSATTTYEMLARAIGWYTARRLDGLRSPLTVVLDRPPSSETQDLLAVAVGRNLNLVCVLLDLGRKAPTSLWNPLRREAPSGHPEELCEETGMRLVGCFDARKPDRLERELDETLADGGTRLVVVQCEAPEEASSGSLPPVRVESGWASELLLDNVLERMALDLADSNNELVFWARSGSPGPLKRLGERLVISNLRGIIEQAVGVSVAGFYPILIVPASGLPELLPELLEYGSFPASVLVADGGLSPLLDGEGNPYYHPAGLRDLSFLRTLPGAATACPADEEEAAALLRAARSHPGFVVLRFSSAPSVGIPGEAVAIGRGRRLRQGKDAAIMVVGSTVFPAVLAAESMRAWGIEVAVYDMRFVRPLDLGLLKEAARCGTLVTVEEHLVTGGFGSSVLEALGQEEFEPVRVRCLGIPEGEHEVATAAPLESFRLHAEGIADTVRQILGLTAPGDF